MNFYYFDIYYILYTVPALLLALWASALVNSRYKKYAKIANSSGLTGADAARRILERNDIYDVRVVPGSGSGLNDYYDPTNKTIVLSQEVYNSPTIAAVGIAAHEAGHAVQDAQGYIPLKIRRAIIPVSNIGSNLGVWLFFIGMLFGFGLLVNVGLLMFSLAVIVQLVTLPVEINASRRAVAAIEREDIFYGNEVDSVKKMLFAAAMTYVAALLQTVAQLLYLISRAGRRNDR